MTHTSRKCAVPWLSPGEPEALEKQKLGEKRPAGTQPWPQLA